jgi:hypothetical protein
VLIASPRFSHAVPYRNEAMRPNVLTQRHDLLAYYLSLLPYLLACHHPLPHPHHQGISQKSLKPAIHRPQPGPSKKKKINLSYFMPPRDLDSARADEEKKGLDVRKVFGVDFWGSSRF